MSLSDKIAITNFSTITNFIRVKDVKEAVKLLKEEGEIVNFHRKGEVDEILVIRIKDFNEIFGDKLTNSEVK